MIVMSKPKPKPERYIPGNITPRSFRIKGTREERKYEAKTGRNPRLGRNRAK
jgi:hypothetical protein